MTTRSLLSRVAGIMLLATIDAPAQSTRLATPLPAPHTLIAHWGAATNTGITLERRGYRRLIVPAPGWQLFPLVGSDDASILSVTWEQRPPAIQPQLLLYATGNPLDLRVTPEGLIPATLFSDRQSGPPPARDKLTFPLPPMPDAEILVTLTADTPVTGQLRIGEAVQTVTAWDRSGLATVRFPAVTTRGSLPLTWSGEATPTAIRLQPLYATLRCRAPQTGHYLFQTIDADGQPGRIIARRLIAGADAAIPAPTGERIGPCLAFHSDRLPLVSNLETDPLFRFDQFHPREPARANTPPYQRWTAAAEATIRIACPPDQEAILHLHLRGARPPHLQQAPASVQIGTRVETVQFTNDVWSIDWTLGPQERSEDGDAIHVILRSQTWRPAEENVSRDLRTLGLMLDRLALTLRPLPKAAAPAGPVPPP